MLIPTLAAAPPAVPPLWRTATEFVYFAALVPVIGGALAYTAVVRPVLPAGSRAAALTRDRAAGLLGGLGPFLLVAAYLQLAGRVARADPHTSFAAALAPARMVRFLLVSGRPGEWVSSGAELIAQNVLFGVAAVLLTTLLTGGGRRRVDGIVATAGGTVAVGSVVNGVPTGPGTADAAVDSLLTQVHILGACSWLGGLVGLTVLARRTRSGLAVDAGLFWARAWQRFSVVAMSAVGAMAVSGSWLAWKHVGGPGELLTTHYGRLLLVKLALVATMVTAGAYNQFRLTPRIARIQAAGERDAGFTLTLRRFPAVVTAEVLLGTGVLLIVPYLAGSARAQHGDGPNPTLDGGVLAVGAVLVVALAGSLYTAHRVSTLLVRNATTG